jgi:hypothetical protein
MKSALAVAASTLLIVAVIVLGMLVIYSAGFLEDAVCHGRAC